MDINHKSNYNVIIGGEIMYHLIPIGNSFGVRIPKAIISQLGFEKDTDLMFKVTEVGLLISPVRSARQGWKEAFSEPCREDEKLSLDTSEIMNQFNQEEWEW